MANENQVNMTVAVMVMGQDEIKKLTTSLGDLTGKVKDHVALTPKATGAVEDWNKSLTKVYPSLQSLVPMMNFLNIGSLLTGAAISTVAIESMKMAQSFQALLVNIALVGVATNTSGASPMRSFGDTLAEVSALSTALNEPISKVTEAMNLLLPVTRDTGVAESLLVDAEKIHLATGISLTDAVKNIIAAYIGASPVFDDVTKKQLLGMDAVNQMTKAAISQKTAMDNLQISYSDFASRGLEKVMIGLGLLGTALLDVAKSPAAIIQGLWSLQDWMDVHVPWMPKLWQIAVTAIGQGWITEIAGIKKNITDMINWFKDEIPKIGTFFKNMWNDALNDAKNFIKTVEDWITSLAEKIKGLFSGGGGTSKKSSAPEPTPDVPVVQMAAGGTIPEPTLLTSIRTGKTYGMAGEAGAETVSPGGAGPVTFNINMDGNPIAQLIWNRMENQVRLRGAY